MSSEAVGQQWQQEQQQRQLAAPEHGARYCAPEGRALSGRQPEHAQSHRLLERLGVTDMSYLFNSMVNFNADISALGVTGHIRVYVMDMLFYVPTNITRL